MLSGGVDRERLDTLVEINTLINSNYTDLTVLLTRIIESATRLTMGEASSLLLVNPQNDRLYFEIALGTKAADVKRFSLEKGEGIAGWVAENNTSVVVNDVEQDPRFNDEISRTVGFPTTSILAVPMRLKGRCVGVIEIINKRGGQKFTEADLQWLEVFATQAAIAIQNAKAYQQVQEEILLLNEQIQTDRGYHTLIASSAAIKEKLAIVERAAITDSTVLLLGESGVGKELFAEQIHLKSRRREAPFVRVNCAALPEPLLESELFGHVKGAFTDATRDRRGRFELADGGTLFLDEIGELPLGVQGKLLRVLQQRTFEKVGSSNPTTVDVRLVAATNKDIERSVAEKRFRADLYYRLNVLPVVIPPLRDRREDIPDLARFFLTKFRSETKKAIRGFSDEAMEALLTCQWPGNVRELENAVERAVVMCRDDTIRTGDLVLDVGGKTSQGSYEGQPLKQAVNLFKKHYIVGVLESHNWNQTKAARALRVQRTYLSRLIKELEIART
jgi:Nif-specific regulatory protein